MEVVFMDDALRELYEMGTTKDGQYKKLCRDRRFIAAYVQVVDTMQSVDNVQELKKFSFLHYEKLRYRPESSVRIITNRVERLLFTEHENGVEIRLIEINSTHYENKR